ncbi:hypothetical protein GCM10027405_30540 [Arthrobacter alkaliphilus]
MASWSNGRCAVLTIRRPGVVFSEGIFGSKHPCKPGSNKGRFIRHSEKMTRAFQELYDKKYGNKRGQHGQGNEEPTDWCEYQLRAFDVPPQKKHRTTAGPSNNQEQTDPPQNIPGSVLISDTPQRQGSQCQKNHGAYTRCALPWSSPVEWCNG